MDDRIKAFLGELELKLAGLPEAELKKALDYYDEYLNDALDEGQRAEDLLERLGSPEKIAAVIKAETSIRKAQSSPGLKNYSKALKYARAGITRPFSILWFSIFIFITYSTAILLFCGAVLSAAAACVVLPGMILEAAKIPSKYAPEIIGTAGIGLFLAAICLLLAYGLLVLGRLFIKYSSGLVGRMLNKSRKPLPDVGENAAVKNKSSGRLLRVILVSAAAGLVLSLVSMLPVKLFMIFNSMEPSSIQTHTWEYDSASVGSIRIQTAHSHIRLVKGTTDKVAVTYEQPDWLEADISNNSGQLTFYEKSNGRMPLFGLVSMHENRTAVTVSLPEGAAPEDVKLESRGGYVYIEGMDLNIRAETYTGNIFLQHADGAKSGLKASTSTGSIKVTGIDAGTKSAEGLTYQAAGQNGSSIELDTSRGSIFID